MKILVLDPDSTALDQLHNLLLEITNAEIFSCSSIIDALNCLELKKPELIIVDMSFNFSEIISYLENHHKIGLPIIFSTNQPNTQLYELSKTYIRSCFIVKPFHLLSLKSCIENIMNASLKFNVNDHGENILVRGLHNEKIKVHIEDIMYIKSNLNYSILTTSKSNFVIKSSLNQLLTSFRHQLIQVHRSYLINKKYISQVEFKISKVILLNKTSIPLGRNHKETVNDFIVSKLK